MSVYESPLKGSGSAMATVMASDMVVAICENYKTNGVVDHLVELFRAIINHQEKHIPMEN